MKQTTFPATASLVLVTTTVAFCSLMYELILAQTLTALFGGLVLRYSVTIGLYLFGLGLGAFSFVYFKSRAAQYFIINQLILSFLGSVGLASVLMASAWQYYFSWAVLLYAHSLIVAIGFFSGLEIPLLGQIYKKKFTQVLGFDYFGGLLAGLAFPLWFYPQWGLLYSSLVIATLNVSLCLWAVYALKANPLLKGLTITTVLVFVALIMHHQSIIHALEWFYLTREFNVT